VSRSALASRRVLTHARRDDGRAHREWRARVASRRVACSLATTMGRRARSA
jgi:hypothetical protein